MKNRAIQWRAGWDLFQRGFRYSGAKAGCGVVCLGGPETQGHRFGALLTDLTGYTSMPYSEGALSAADRNVLAKLAVQVKKAAKGGR